MSETEDKVKKRHFLLLGKVIEVCYKAIKDHNAGKNAWRLSSHMMGEALLIFFTECKLWPTGLSRELPCVQHWALKEARAIVKLVMGLHWKTGLDLVVGSERQHVNPPDKSYPCPPS